MDEDQPAFEEIAHTADLQIIAYGSSLKELFINSGRGMYSVAGAEYGESESGSRSINLDEHDNETLLISYLEELLFLADQRLMVVDPELNISLTELSGELPLYSLKKMKIEIKAVTYHEMEIIEKDGVFRTKITFDI